MVAAQTHVGTARLQEAQDAVGLSNEGIARLIPVSEKTWRRWKEAGSIPTAALPAVAKALRLELVEPPGRLAVEPAVSVEAHLAELADSVAQILEGQKEILEALRELRPARRRDAAKNH